MKEQRSRFADAVVVYANHAQFAPGQRVGFAQVSSRMVLWCKAGRGEVRVNDVTFAMEPGRYLVLPWGHAVSYRASREEPFLLGGVHLVPDHGRNRPVVLSVAHNPRHELARIKHRRDADIRELAGIRQGWLDTRRPLGHLLEYVVCGFQRGDVDESWARLMGRQVLGELIAEEKAGARIASRELPVALLRMIEFVEFQLASPLSLRDLVGFSGLSASTVGRLFRVHLRVTPVTWILHMRIERAKALLRGGQLSVGEVGRSVGIPDGFYFSKCFKRETGMSPRAWRAQVGWF